jgi:hypothetical protein
MREEEAGNPKVLPPYQPSWWALLNKQSQSVSIEQAAKILGLEQVTYDANLTEVIQRITLSDDGFVAPIYTDASGPLPVCFPQVYECANRDK